MGIFDDPIKSVKDIQIQGVLETNRGCPTLVLFVIGD